MPDPDEIRYRGRPPANREEPAQHNSVEQIQRWQWMLQQKVPIIGGWMHRRITSALTESALAGNWLAAQSLAVVLAFHEEVEVRRQAADTLRKINYATGIDAVWGVWAETRSPSLEKIALEYNRIAMQPATVRLLSALCMSIARPEAITAVTQGSADLVPPLIKACDDGDQRIAAIAREAITGLRNQASIDAVCSAWTDSRYAFLDEVIEQASYVAQKPPAVRVLSALRVDRTDVVMQGTPEMVAPLIKACEHPDGTMRERARYCLLQLQNQPAVDEFCKLWAQSRAPLLERVLLQAGYHARHPLHVRLVVALKTGRLAAAEKVSPEGLPALIEAVRDRDPDIAANARKALNHLTNPDTIEALCVRVIEEDDAFARQVALENDYAPRTPEIRALFYFLTGQWQEYDALDFDQSMLRAVYEASALKMRQRISAQVQAAARTDYLTILAGVDYRSRAEQVSPEEADLMIRILVENGELERLWRLAPELALPFSLKIIRLLDDRQWSPPDEMDRPVFMELARLSRQPVMIAGDQLARLLPLAVSRATVRVRGRVNDVAFSPVAPVLAIAASSRKVVLWDFQAAKIVRVLDDFKHSVGKVCFTPGGTLICAERTNDPNAMLMISVYQPEDSYRLSHHQGNITVLETVGDSRMLTAGRDGKVVLWDLEQRRVVGQKEFDFWPRSAAVSADKQYAALMHDKLLLVRLPELTVVPGYPFLTARTAGYKTGVAQNAAFSPDGKYLLAGQYNGQVGLYFHTSLTQRPKRGYVTQHPGPVRGLAFLPGHPLAISAGGEGQVRFIRWPEMTVQGTVYAPEGQITSLRVSNNGAFLATGTNDATLTLWDLRVLDIPGLFTQPLATANHDHIANVLALSEYYSLPEPVRNGLKFLRLLLQYRFRFDIQIEEGPIIRYGEFDIILDEL